MIRRATFSVGVLLVALSSAAAVGAEADEAARVFASLYGKELRRVRATAAVADDLALAERLLAAAEQAKATPALGVLLLETAAGLAEGHADGHGTAVRALEALARADPAGAASAAQRILAIRQKQFAAAKGEAKTAAGETLIDALLAKADAAGEADDLVGATALLRRAQSAARSIQSKRAADIDGRLAAVAHAAQTARALAMFKERLQKDPSDQEARGKLVRLLLVDRNSPARAAEYVAGLEDETLRENVPAAAKPLADMPETQCVPMGDGYRSLAEQAPGPAKAGMLARAARYYERFLRVHTSEDLPRTAATLALEKVRSAMAKLGGVRPAEAAATAPVPASGVIRPGRWIDLLPLVRLPADAVSGTWKRQGDDLLLLDGYWSHLQLPAVPRGSYELQVVFTRTGGRQDIPVHLPVGASSVMLNMNREDYAGLGLIHGKGAHENASSVHYGKRLTNDVRHTLTVKVVVRGSAAAIEGRLEGPDDRVVRWQGPVSALSPGAKHQVIDGRALGLGAHQAQITYHSVRLKMLSGEALLR